MARLARVVVPGMPHHVTQRGNRRQQTFFCDGDYEAYLDLMAQWRGEHNVEVWAYCLMPNCSRARQPSSRSRRSANTNEPAAPWATTLSRNA